MRIMLYYLSKSPLDLISSNTNLAFSYKSNARNSKALTLAGIGLGDTFYEYKILVDPRRILFTDNSMYNRIFGTINGFTDQLNNCKVLYSRIDKDRTVSDDLINAIRTNSINMNLTPEVLKDIYVERKLGISYPRKTLGDEVIIYNPSLNKDYLTLVSEVKQVRK